MLKKLHIFLLFSGIFSLPVFSQISSDIVGEWKLSKHIADMAGEDENCAVFYDFMTISFSADSTYTLNIKAKDTDVWKGFGKWRVVKNGTEIFLYDNDAKPKRINETFPDHTVVVNKYNKGKLVLEEKLCTVDKPGLSYYSKVLAK